LKLKDELDERRRKLGGRLMPQSTLAGKQTPPDETDVEVLIRAVVAILDHLAEREARALRSD
jgi:hypothetical protein